jgi:integrase
MTAIRSLRPAEWPRADREAWDRACRPSQKLARGGAAAHLKPVSRDDLARRYGMFLDFVERTEGLEHDRPAGGYVTEARVRAYLAELQARVGSVTRHYSIAKLCRMTELIAPGRDLLWLKELAQELEWAMRPEPKFDRIVDTDRLVRAGFTLMQAAREGTDTGLCRARNYRDGLMVSLLACAPIRLKNFAALTLGTTLQRTADAWWILLPAEETKSRRPDQRPLPAFLTSFIDEYVAVYRPMLGEPDDHLWIGTYGRPLSYSACERILTETTRKLLGVPVSPHLFRKSAATWLAFEAGQYPHLASAVLDHTDPTTTERHYNKVQSANAARLFAGLVKKLSWANGPP